MGRVRRLLSLAGVAVMTALVPASGGCLVVSDPDFRGQDQCVPSLLLLEANPSVRERPRIEESEFSGTVPMRSCALTFDYEARIFVDGSLVQFQRIPPNGLEIRDVPVLVDIKRLRPGCHVVEVFVSSQFRGGSDFITPERKDDIAFISWTFLNDTDASVASCGGV